MVPMDSLNLSECCSRDLRHTAPTQRLLAPKKYKISDFFKYSYPAPASARAAKWRWQVALACGWSDHERRLLRVIRELRCASSFTIGAFSKSDSFFQRAFSCGSYWRAALNWGLLFLEKIHRPM